MEAAGPRVMSNCMGDGEIIGDRAVKIERDYRGCIGWSAARSAIGKVLLQSDQRGNRRKIRAAVRPQ